MLEWQDDLKLAGTGLYLDSRSPRPLCFVSHAHSDHLGAHEQAIATPETFALAERRAEILRSVPLGYCHEYVLNGSTELQLLPAGHVLGSAMLYVRRGDDRFIYTGDFK